MVSFGRGKVRCGIVRQRSGEVWYRSAEVRCCLEEVECCNVWSGLDVKVQLGIVLLRLGVLRKYHFRLSYALLCIGNVEPSFVL